MKRIAVFMVLWIVLGLCGCEKTSVRDSNSGIITESSAVCVSSAAVSGVDDSQSMVEAGFTVVDEAGEPVLNLWGRLEALEGEKGSFMPGYASTDAEGRFERWGHPAVYNLVLEDRTELRYSAEVGYDPGSALRSSQVFRVEITDKQREFKLVWKGSTPDKVSDADKTKAVITVLDKQCKPVAGLWISLFVPSTDPYESEQICVGFTDTKGNATWCSPVAGEFKVAIYYIDKPGEGQNYTLSLDAEDVKGVWNGGYVWPG